MFLASALLMGLIGTAALAGPAIANQCAVIVYMVPYGIAQAATVRVGRAVGAGKHRALTRAGWTALALGIGFAFLPAAAFWFFGGGYCRSLSRFGAAREQDGHRSRRFVPRHSCPTSVRRRYPVHIFRCLAGPQGHAWTDADLACRLLGLGADVGCCVWCLTGFRRRSHLDQPDCGRICGWRPTCPALLGSVSSLKRCGALIHVT